MTAMPWAKLYTEVLDDAKLGRLSDRAQLRFYQLIAYAAECDSLGDLVNGDKPLVAEDMAWRLRVDETDLLSDLEELREHGLISFENDVWSVTNFEKRQGRSTEERREQDRIRQQRHRNVTPGVTNDVTRDDCDNSHACHAPRVEESRVDKSREEVDAECDNDIPIFSQFSVAFTNKTHIPELTGGQKWPEAIKALVKTGATVEDMLQAIDELPEKYKITGPWSIHNATVNVMSKRLRTKDKNTHPDPDIDYLRLNPKGPQRGLQREAVIARLKQRGVPFSLFKEYLNEQEVQECQT